MGYSGRVATERLLSYSQDLCYITFSVLFLCPLKSCSYWRAQCVAFINISMNAERWYKSKPFSVMSVCSEAKVCSFSCIRLTPVRFCFLNKGSVWLQLFVRVEGSLIWRWSLNSNLYISIFKDFSEELCALEQLEWCKMRSLEYFGSTCPE